MRQYGHVDAFLSHGGPTHHSQSCVLFSSTMRPQLHTNHLHYDPQRQYTHSHQINYSVMASTQLQSSVHFVCLFFFSSAFSAASDTVTYIIGNTFLLFDNTYKLWTHRSAHKIQNADRFDFFLVDYESCLLTDCQFKLSLFIYFCRGVM